METQSKHMSEASRGDGASAGGRQQRKLLGVTGLALATSIGLFWLSSSQGADAPAAPPPAPVVTVSKPILRSLNTRVALTGQFSSTGQVEFRAQVGGTLTGIHFKDGDVVKKGALLFTIDAQPYEIKLAQANSQLQASKARLELAERELKRAQDLERDNAGTTQTVEQKTFEFRSAKASVEGATAQVRDAQFDLDHCRITAPIAGRMGTHLISVGNLISGSRGGASQTTLLATLVTLDPVYLNFDLSESDYQTYLGARGRQGKNQASKIRYAVNGQQKLAGEGQMDFINNTLDRSSGTIRARALVANPDFLLTPGQFAKISLAIGTAAPTLLVPDTVVLPDQASHVVMTVTADGTIAPKQVDIGEMRGGLRTIRSGLTADDRVVLDGLAKIAPGAKVQAREGSIQYADGQD
jgi:multidrug efflux system membrane fusion protein